MKYLKLILICYMAGNISLQARQKEFESTIDKVTVFSKGAQVERKAEVALIRGEQQVIIKNLPKNLDESTITVKPVRSVIRSISYRIDYLKKEKVRVAEELKLYEQIETYEKQIADLAVQLEIIDEEVSFIKANRSVSGKLKGNSLNEIKGINEYYSDRITALYKLRHDYSNQIADSRQKVKKIKQQLNYRKNTVNESAGELLLTIEANGSLTEKLVISYYIEEAGWFPSYDFRVKNVNSPMEAVYKANVSQQTGEDWKEVDVVISSANPKETSRAPEMDIWRIDRFVAPPFEKKPSTQSGVEGEVSGRVVSATDGEGLPGINVLIKGTTIGTITDIDGNYSIQVPDDQVVLEFSFIGMKSQSRLVGDRAVVNVALEENTQQLEEVVVTGYQGTIRRNLTGSVSGVTGASPGIRIRGIGSIKPTLTISSNIITKSGQVDFELTIKGKQTVISGQRKKALDMLTYEVDADYQYICSPRYNTGVFLFAYISDWEDLNLLSGEINLFYEGVYKGKTLLDINSSSDT
ncbi:MAG: mucoidy inhibitor MuiA family protein, partial [Cyclobacteriaceae bacterium]